MKYVIVLNNLVFSSKITCKLVFSSKTTNVLIFSSKTASNLVFSSECTSNLVFSSKATSNLVFSSKTATNLAFSPRSKYHLDSLFRHLERFGYTGFQVSTCYGCRASVNPGGRIPGLPHHLVIVLIVQKVQKRLRVQKRRPSFA